MKRHYIHVSPFALASVLSALDKDKEHARNITVSLEDNDLLVAYDEAPKYESAPQSNVVEKAGA